MSHDPAPGPSANAPEPRANARGALGLRTDLLADVAAGVTDAATGPVGDPPAWLRLPERPGQRVAAVVLGCTAATGVLVAVAAQLGALGVGGLGGAVIAAAQTVPLIAVFSSPLLAGRWLVLALFAGTLFMPADQGWTWPVTSLLLLAGLLYLVASTHPRRTVLGVGVLTTAVAFVPGWLLKDVSVLALLMLGGLAALVLVLGDTVRDRGVVRSRLASATAQRREDLARQAVLEERSHIARELHDVVAHHMSMIALQAEAAPLRYPDLSPEVVRTFGVIRDASREALGEMRRVVGALRSDSELAERAPQPGADQLAALVEASRRSGMGVDLAVTGSQRPLPPAVDISAYRVVQEALSNVRRHAPGAAVRVAVHYGVDVLTIRVTDDGGRTVRADG